jgi:hypothetical protein
MTKKKVPATAEAADAPEGTTRLYPTHRLSTGPLRIALPAVEGHSDELVIDDDGADVPEAIAAYAIASRDATTDAPAED